MLNVGFLGCSYFVRYQHLQNAHFSKVCRVHTLCDLNGELLKQMNAQFPAVKTTEDYETMLRDPDVQLIVIAMLPTRHAEMTLRAIAAGKHVLVEKPMAETVEDCRTVVRRANEKGVHVRVGFNRRFAPAMQSIERRLANRKGPAMIEYSVVNDGTWRLGTHWVGRNGLLDEIVHMFDVTSWLIGCEPIRIFASDSGLNNNFVVVEYADGSAVMINANENATNIAPKEMMRLTFDGQFIAMKEFVEVEVVSSQENDVERFAGRKYMGVAAKYDAMIDEFTKKGFDGYRQFRDVISRLLLADREGTLTEVQRKDIASNKLPPLNYCVDKGWAASLDHLAMCIARGKTPGNADGHDGIRATVLAEQAIASAASHQAIELDSGVWRNV